MIVVPIQTVLLETSEPPCRHLRFNDNGNPTTCNAETLTYDGVNRLTAYGADRAQRQS